MPFAFNNLSPFTKCDEGEGQSLPRVASHATDLSCTSTFKDGCGNTDSGTRKDSVATIDSMMTAVDSTAPQCAKRGDEKHIERQPRLAESVFAVDEVASTATERPWWHPVSLLWTLVENWFLIGLGVFVVLAWAFPTVGMDGGEYTVSYGAIALIFLITGLTLSTQALYRQIRNWYSHLYTQMFSLLFFPAVMFAIVSIIKACDDPRIDPYILVGLMMMAILPTTVAANVTMTREAEGNEEAAIAECCIGQVLGIFFSPLLLQMFMSAPGWEYGVPVADGGQSSSDGLKQIYKEVGQHMGLAIFLPMAVGQAIQNFFPVKTKWVATTFRLPKVGSFLLLILIWSIFCNQFEQDAFNLVSRESIILVVFLNLVLYLVFTALCVVCTRLPFLPAKLIDPTVAKMPKWRKIAAGARFGKAEATAICFCAAAKGLVVGSPILDILYGGMTPAHRAIISIPLVLYQGEQIACGQLLTYLFRKWNREEDALVSDADSSEKA